MYPKILFVGYVVKDINVFSDRKVLLPGGAAYFAALAASLLIQPVGLVTRIGGDYNTNFLFSRILKQGIHTSSKKKTGTSIMTYLSKTDLTQRDMKVECGVTRDIQPKDIPKKWHPLPVHIHIATMPPEQQKLFVDFVKVKMKNAVISIDTDIAWLKADENREIVHYNFSKCDIVFANRLEYDILKSTVDKACEAIVKLDEDGAYILKKGKVVERVPAKKVKPVDVTGAGDIFAGTYLAMRSKGKSIHESLTRATETATLSVTKEGVEHLFL